MNIEVIKRDTKNSGNLFLHYIFGLNIFHYNDVTDRQVNGPSYEFLRALTTTYDVAGNTGNLYDFADLPDELFGPYKYSGSYELVGVGCYGGNFYNYKDWTLFPTLFLPKIGPEFINLVRDEGDSLIGHIAYSDALGLFISPLSADSEDNLRGLLNSPLLSSGDFIEKACSLYKAVMVTKGDDNYYCLYSLDDSFDFLDEPLARALSVVETSDWFKSNKSRLEWDSGLSMCWLLPE